MNDNDNQNSGEGDNYDKYDSDGELNADGERQKSGPWNKVAEDGTSAAVDATAVAAAAATTATAALQERNSASSVYISPALRNGPVRIHEIFTIKYKWNITNFTTTFHLLQLQKTTKLRKGVLPDIHNEEYFPVLGSAKPEEVKKKKPEPGFEEVKHGHGHRVQRPTEASTAPVAIGNRFNSLSDS